MLSDFFDKLKEVAENTSHIEAVLLVGSYAKGTNTKNSDIDIVIITSHKAKMIATHDFIQQFGIINKQQIEFYGACTSIRAWYKDGNEVEFGIVAPSWISKPLDIGTHNVLADGYKIIIDKKQYFKELIL